MARPEFFILCYLCTQSLYKCVCVLLGINYKFQFYFFNFKVNNMFQPICIDFFGLQGRNVPGDVGLRNPGISGRADVLPWAFILPSMATACLAVSFLTQSVWEIIITVKQRQSDIETWNDQQEGTDKANRTAKRGNSANRWVCHICNSPIMAFDILFPLSQHASSGFQGPESQMSHGA